MKKSVICFLLLLLLLASCGAAEGEVVISEVCASNRCIYFDDNGDAPDWVELYNPGAAEVTLTGYFLSDKTNGKKQLPLENVTIPAGGYALVPLNGNCPFGLSASGETVYLLKGSEIVDEFAFPAGEKDVSFVRADGETVCTYLPTPGGENRLLAQGESFTPVGSVRFNEFLTSAAPFYKAKGYDFFEIINSGNLNVSLKGYTMRLGMAGSKSYTFDPDYLADGQCMGVYCETDAISGRNTGFALPAQGAVCSLWNGEGELVDFIRLPEQYGNISYGLSRDGSAWGYFAASSFGQRNNLLYAGQTESPAFLLSGGVYQEAVTVEIQVPEGAQVYYTLNGSIPTQQDSLYTAPIQIAQTMALTAVAIRENEIPSTEVSATYIIGLSDAVPVVCITMDKKYIYGSEGIFQGDYEDKNSNLRSDLEYPGTFEFFSADGTSMINQRCGISAQGNSSRHLLQKAFHVAARNAYGEDMLAFNPFENRSFSMYKSLNVRMAGSEGNASSRFRDAFLTSLAEGTSLLYSAACPVLVYVNGSLYGEANLRECINKYFIAQHTGVTDKETIEQIDLLDETGIIVRNGGNEDWFALSNYMKVNDLNDPDKLDYVLSQMDVDSYFDYVCFLMMTGNDDLSNTRFYRVPGDKWRWVLYDLDMALENVASRDAFWLYTLDINHEIERCTDHVPFVALMKVPEMKDKFLTRLGELMAEKFTTASLLAGITKWHDLVAPLIPYHCDRWQLMHTGEWEQMILDMKGIAKARPNVVVEYAQTYFRLTDEETEKYFGAFRLLQQQ